MKSIDKYCILESSTANDAIEAILASKDNQRLVFIVNKYSKILGTLSEGDIMRALLINKNIDNILAISIMNKSFKFLLKEDLEAARKLIIKYNITIIPIVTKNMKIKSIIKLNDVFSYKNN
jgi:Mg/Co/Ni transporter MgtE